MRRPKPAARPPKTGLGPAIRAMTEHLFPPGVQEGVLHGSAVALEGRGLLILGPSGSGKSSLALQLVALGAGLIADDGTHVRPAPAAPLLSCPDSIAGRIEARGLGLLRLPPAPQTPAWAVLRLVREPGPRLPETRTIDVAGHRLPLLSASLTAHLAASLLLCLRHRALPDPVDP